MHAPNIQYTGQGLWKRSPWGALVLLACVSVLALSAWSASTDYALIMPKARSSLLLDITAAGDRLVAVGERGHILYSGDAAQTWVQAKVPTSVMLTRVFFVSGSTGWAVGHDGNILLSTDSGVNWTLQRDGVSDQSLINEDRVARARGKISDLQQQLTSATPEQQDAQLEALDEAQSALETALDIMDEPVYAPPLMDIWFASEEQGWASGAFGSLLRTSNAGRSWDDWSYKLDNPEELHLNGIVGDTSGTLYLGSEWGIVFRSTTNGETWEAVETGFEGSFFGLVVNPVSGSVFAYGLLGNIYRSTDRGQTWQQLNAHTGSSLFGGASAADGTLVFVGVNGTAVLSRDDGDSFIALEQGSSRGLYGVTAMSDGHFIATGEGGSVPLSGASDTGR